MLEIKKRNSKVVLFWLILVMLLVWGVITGISVWRFSFEVSNKPADSIIILGAAVSGNKPSPVFEERIKHGINLYQQGLAKKIIFTGGVGSDKDFSESAVGRSVALRAGVPLEDILIEQLSRTTQENLHFAKNLMESSSLHSAIIVSDPLHMKRAIIMAEDLGIDAQSSPTPTTKYKGLKVRFDFLLREIYFINHYHLTGQ